MYLIVQIPNGNSSGQLVLWFLCSTFQLSLLPQTLLRHPLVKTFLYDSDEKPYHDNFCLFRAIAFEKFGSDGVVASTKYLVSELLFKRQQNFYRCFTE